MRSKDLAELYYMFDLSNFISFSFSVVENTGRQVERPFGLDLSIDAMRANSYSVGVFIFLIIGILVFLSVGYFFMKTDKKTKLKKGEIFLLIWIVFGVVFAIVMGATQLLGGFLL